MKLLLGMLKYMVRPEEITKVKLNSKWDDDNNDYVIPPFVFQEGNVKFPKLAQNQSALKKVLCLIIFFKFWI